MRVTPVEGTKTTLYLPECNLQQNSERRPIGRVIVHSRNSNVNLKANQNEMTPQHVINSEKQPATATLRNV